ncbi:hypothetical protein V2J09_011839 [Rumex salicifolius]
MRINKSGSLLSFSLFVVAIFLGHCPRLALGATRHYNFDVKLKNVTRLCHTKTILTINGKLPGPRIVAREGDNVLVRVSNHVQNNVTFHWHGIKQLRSGWADGPAYVTQCPIQTNSSYVYNFTITGQRGTLWWHAHVSWLRATLYGPIVILPKRNESYPFPKPHKEVVIMFGEWWNNDTEAVINQALQTGGGPNVSDAYTFNGLPGPLYNCSAQKANHTLTVVEADAAYVKPFATNTVLITPGQTTGVLLKTKPNAAPGATYLMAVRPYSTGNGTFDNTTAAAILEYQTTSSSSSSSSSTPPTKAALPPLPAINDTSFFTNFTGKFRSLANPRFPANVPQTVDKNFFFTVGLGTNPCPNNQTCKGPTNTTKFAASVNNVSFVLPSKALLQSYFSGQSNGVFTSDFPGFPVTAFNYTGTPPNNTNVANGTKVVVLPYNATVELVMQGTGVLTAESHPLHLHGHNMYVVGQGFGNFNPVRDPVRYNLVDPVERNTVSVPAGGWVAVRFRADNPGVWFMHCHIEVHLSWGLRMAWVVLDGKLPNQKLSPPPSDLPKC